MELFKDLYRQPVNETVKIRGVKGEDPDPNKKISVYFTLNGFDKKTLTRRHGLKRSRRLFQRNHLQEKFWRRYLKKMDTAIQAA